MLPSLPLYRAEALRAVEREALQALAGDGMALMQRAGQAAWRELLAHWPDARRITLLCGPGNNGGDGLVLARHALQSGCAVHVMHAAGHGPRSALAQRALDAVRAAGGEIHVFAGDLPDSDVLVDALFGIGLARAPDAACAALIDAVNASPLPVLALDVPSGLDADTGGAPGALVQATRTLEFIAGHPGTRTGAGIVASGALSLAALEIEPALLAKQPVAAQSPGREALAGALPPRERGAHKGHHGHVLCVGGEQGSGGAILLAAEAALRSGAGLVSVATRPLHVPALLARRPECMAHGIDAADALQPLLARCDMVAIGPGLGRGAWGRSLLHAALACGKPLVIDADGLNLLCAQDTPALPPHCVLTPHPGEAARLLRCTVAQVEQDRFAAAQQLARRFDAIVVLKGAGSIIAGAEAGPMVVAAGNPGMAVGGMGDVLTGVIAALIAQGHEAREAANLGALLHACAGDVAAAEDGERGLLPADLFPVLRRLVNPGAFDAA